MRKNVLLVVIILLTFLLTGFNAIAFAAPPLPVRVGGTLTVDGTQITDSTDTGYTVKITKDDGTAYDPAAEDMDGLNSYDYYIIDVPSYDSSEQPGGAQSGETAVVHVYLNGTELTVTSPVNGAFQVGSSGSTDQIDIVAVSGPDITVTPTTISFGNVNINSSSDKTVTVTNDSSVALNIDTITDPSSPFSKVSDNCSDTSLASSASCTITIRFSPATLDDFNSTFNIPSNDSDENPVTVALTGTGEWLGTPDIDVSGNSFSFLNIVPGTDSDQTLTITNQGDGYLNINSIASPSAPFSIVSGEDGCSNSSITPNQSCTVKIRFNSSTTGAFDSSISITSDDPDEGSVDIGLLGSATPVTNDHPTDPSPVSPANGATGMPTTITFQWTKSDDSNGVTYKLYCDTNPSFTGATPVQVASLQSIGIKYADIGSGIGIMLFGIVLSGGIRNRKKIILMFLMIGVLSISCGSGGGGGSTAPPTEETPVYVSETVSGLSSGTTYYWKVVADDGNGGVTESATQSFTTQ